MPINLRDLLADGKVHVLDGAMGTMLYSKGFFLNVCYDELNLKQPKLVQEVHEAYVRAGAEILETFSDVDEIHEALRAVRSLSDLPVIAQMTIGDDGLTHYGTGPETFAKQLTEWGADAVGVNCSVGPAGVLEAVEKLVKATDRPISAVPNAGLPKDVGDRKIYLASPEYMASYARRMIEAGARLVGGCCGTTPEHIKKIRDYVASVVPRPQPPGGSRGTVTPPPGGAGGPSSEGSRRGAKIARGELVTSVEIVPPKGVDATPMLEQCRALKAAGVDAVNVPDGPRAQSRMGVLPSAILIQREVGIWAVIHYCCRDRNLL